MNSSGNLANGIGQPMRRKKIFVSSPARAVSPMISIYREWRML
jgi:hypothetical protein